MPIYDKAVWQLMHEMVSNLQLTRGDVLEKQQVLDWFSENYPLIKKGTITAHLLRMSTNAPSRVHYHPKAGDDDLLYQLDGSRFRLYEPASDSPPIYLDALPPPPPLEQEDPSQVQFAYEADLRNFLVKNLNLIEPGLKLYEDEGINGVEFPAGGRWIDILAVSKAGELVVIELKVSRGYDRVIGQLLRYIGWVKENLAENGQKVRGVIVARSISEDLLLATRDLPSLGLFEYQLSVQLKGVR